MQLVKKNPICTGENGIFFFWHFVLDRQLMNDRYLEHRPVAKTLLPIQGTLLYIMPIARTFPEKKTVQHVPVSQ